MLFGRAFCENPFKSVMNTLTKDKREALASRLSLVKERSGLEPIAEELSGGQFLPPVQTLVATLIFARPTQGQKGKSSPVTGT